MSDPMRVALQAILNEAQVRVSWGEDDLDVWLRQLRMADRAGDGHDG